ncbi:MAG: peptidoglycan-binding domain-containing protein [Betaproteobacteria bacterium]|nr:peptidoglycan-binding domain-containing protein [Betaproteobacteria bacterium]
MNMPIVEVAIGLMVVYLLLAILCSSAVEMIAGFLGLRGEMLWKGVESMLGGRGAGGPVARVAGIARALLGNFVSGAASPAAPQAEAQVYALSSALIEHPLIDSMRNAKRAPSYLSADRFAVALLDTLSRTYRGERRLYADFGQTVSALPDGPLKANLEIVLKETGGDASLARQRIEAWYDETMQRVSGWYKRQTQWLLLAFGLFAAVSLNVDSIDLAMRIWREPMLRAVAVRSAEAYAAKSDHDSSSVDERARGARTELEALGAAGMPIGWPTPWLSGTAWDADRACALLRSVLGWIITALAVSLGAPYWYDLLLKLLPLAARSSGPRPNPTEPAAAPSVAAAPPAPTAPPSEAPAPDYMPFRNALNAYETELSEADVREIQTELGLSGAQVTGNLDQTTREAIENTQKARGLNASGELNSAFVGDLLRSRRTR